jgi:cytochrome c
VLGAPEMAAPDKEPGFPMMDEFELSKVSGAVIAALLVMLAPSIVGDLLGGHSAAHGEKIAGYALPMPKPVEAKAEAGAGAATAAAFDPGAVMKLLASARPENGEGVFKRCAGCHSNDKAAKSGAGPNLWGLVGRKKGGREDFGGYSEAIKAKGGDWNYADLAAFLHNPKEWMPGTKMAVAIGDTAELADLMAYLRTLSDSPVALP